MYSLLVFGSFTTLKKKKKYFGTGLTDETEENNPFSPPHPEFCG
jgi:hypothetical protein